MQENPKRELYAAITFAPTCIGAVLSHCHSFEPRVLRQLPGPCAVCGAVMWGPFSLHLSTDCTCLTCGLRVHRGCVNSSNMPICVPTRERFTAHCEQQSTSRIPEVALTTVSSTQSMTSDSITKSSPSLPITPQSPNMRTYLQSMGKMSIAGAVAGGLIGGPLGAVVGLKAGAVVGASEITGRSLWRVKEKRLAARLKAVEATEASSISSEETEWHALAATVEQNGSFPEVWDTILLSGLQPESNMFAADIGVAVEFLLLDQRQAPFHVAMALRSQFCDRYATASRTCVGNANETTIQQESCSQLSWDSAVVVKAAEEPIVIPVTPAGLSDSGVLVSPSHCSSSPSPVRHSFSASSLDSLAGSDALESRANKTGMRHTSSASSLLPNPVDDACSILHILEVCVLKRCPQITSEDARAAVFDAIESFLAPTLYAPVIACIIKECKEMDDMLVRRAQEEALALTFNVKPSCSPEALAALRALETETTCRGKLNRMVETIHSIAMTVEGRNGTSDTLDGMSADSLLAVLCYHVVHVLTENTDKRPPALYAHVTFVGRFSRHGGAELGVGGYAATSLEAALFILASPDMCSQAFEMVEKKS